MAALLHYIVFLSALVQGSESSIETLKQFVLKGENVHLDVQGYAKLNNIEDFKWTFNKSHTLVKYSNESSTVKVYTKYQGRVEFSEANFSLVLKNLQEGDSGLYDAGVSGEENKDVAKYHISVQERVVTPVLTVDSNSTINGNCNVTVTCRGQNTSVTSSCNSSTCSQVGGESRGAETSTIPLLSVYVAGGSIICNHSNQVSWAPNMKEIETICASNSKPERDKENQNYNVGIIIIIFIIIIFVGCVLIAWQKLNKGYKEDSINTEYATVRTPCNSHVGGEEQESTGPGPTTPTIYSEVGLPQPQLCELPHHGGRRKSSVNGA
ncbi:SLAM family member 9 isoform X1 [Oncorhynchus kisutch]|uniref:SLAM family member 9 isoform X1 n=1 Tax=Oncorhynchus kisutch TaxID=8019 RepID=UPI00099FEF14|nr:SLAM family member 9 isoform X1 [Oncorhynchus kisutch]